MKKSHYSLKLTIGRILIGIISGAIVIIILSCLGGFSQPELLVSMHPLTQPLVNTVLILHVDLFNMGSDTARNCEINFWPYGMEKSDKVSAWAQKLDFTAWREAFIHFPYVYN